MKLATQLDAALRGQHWHARPPIQLGWQQLKVPLFGHPTAHTTADVGVSCTAPNWDWIFLPRCKHRQPSCQSFQATLDLSVFPTPGLGAGMYPVHLDAGLHSPQMGALWACLAHNATSKGQAR